MAKEICISTTPHETRLAILEDDQLAEIYYERENEYTLAGSIYKGRVTRVLPGMQSAFVDLGLERDAFLYVTDFLEEQEEDSADFERIDAAPRGDGANGSGRRQREPREARPQPQESTTDLQAAEAPSRHADREPRGGDAEGESGTRRWHGRRGRRFRGRGQRSDESDRSDRPQRSDRPLESPEVVEEAISSEPVALPERGAPGGIPSQNVPIVLPGESLSKYGRRADSGPAAPSPTAPARPAPPPSTFKPSTLIEVPTGWDGGDVLPGESLSRHRRSEPRSSETRTAEPRPSWSEPSASMPSEIAPADRGTIVLESEPDFDSEPSFASTPVAHAAVAEPSEPPVQPETAWSAEPLESAEPIPAEQSAEPAAPATQPEIAVGLTTHAPEPSLASAAAPVTEIVEEVHEYEPEAASASHRVEPSHSEMRFSAPVDEEVIEEEDQLPEPAPAAPAPTEDSAPAAAESQPSPEAEVVRQLFGYAPGMGVLEEETIDEEEYDFEPIHGEADEHGPEELEEETLDHAATLGDAVRDVHIDQRLGYSTPAEASEDEETDEPETGYAEVEDEPGFEESESDEDESDEPAAAVGEAGESAGAEAPARERREGRRPDRFDRRGSRGRQQGGRRHGGRRPNMQTSDLPIISELLKQGQEILVQIAKEPIARKGARITSHIALPGRFLVFMPTVNHVGVSRKIESDEERQRLKRILISEKAGAPGGFIVRTAAESASEDDLRADIRFLLNLWAEIKQRSDSAKAPALIYHDLNLIERILRDQVSDNFSTIWVDSESEYERIVRFLNRFQPSLVRRVKLYTKETPLFEQFGIQDEISKALKSKVWLKSGGSIVINQTEALVAIDINTGKYVGKTARLEDTILRTNLDAIPEIVRQIRLRDLGGIIVIDFIDMDERRNRQKVTAALEDALKADRAPSKVLQFNDFGLVAITRKRVKQSLERTLSVPCPVCTGTGMVKSPVTVANEIWIEMRKMMRHFERNDVLLRVHPEVVKILKANNAKWLNELEEMIGKTLIVKSDPALPPEQFDIQG